MIQMVLNIQIDLLVSVSAAAVTGMVSAGLSAGMGLEGVSTGAAPVKMKHVSTTKCLNHISPAIHHGFTDNFS